jgi:hypothetical protein
MRWSGVQVPQGPPKIFQYLNVFIDMGLIDKKKIFKEILVLKFKQQTKEIKKQIQKLQQKIDLLK